MRLGVEGGQESRSSGAACLAVLRLPQQGGAVALASLAAHAGPASAGRLLLLAGSTPADALRLAEGEGPAAVLGMLKSLNALMCGNKCAVGSGGKSVG